MRCSKEETRGRRFLTESEHSFRRRYHGHYGDAFGKVFPSSGFCGFQSSLPYEQRNDAILVVTNTIFKWSYWSKALLG